MGFFNNLLMTALTGVNYFNRDEYGNIRRGTYTRPTVTETTTDRRGYPVIHVKADNYIDAAKPIEGTTYPGDVYREIVAKGGREWEIRVQPFRSDLEDTQPTKAMKR